MNRLVCVSITVLLGAAFAAANPEGKAPDRDQLPWVLRKAIENGPKLRYVGTRRIEFRRDGQTHVHREIVTRDGVNMRIEFPTGSPYAGQIIVETATERRHYFPDLDEIRVTPPRREEAYHRLERLGKMTDKLKLTSASGSTIAGHGTRQVVVEDKKGNLLQRIYIEPKTGLLMKRQLFDAVGTQTGLFEFEKVDFSPNISSSVFKLERRGAKIVRTTDLLKAVATKSGFPFAYLRGNSGFHLEFSRVNKIEGKDVLMQFYGSGNGRVTLFQLKSDVSKEQLDKFGRGDVHVYSWKARGNTFVLIGNQDQATLKRLSGFLIFGT